VFKNIRLRGKTLSGKTKKKEDIPKGDKSTYVPRIKVGSPVQENLERGGLVKNREQESHASIVRGTGPNWKGI